MIWNIFSALDKYYAFPVRNFKSRYFNKKIILFVQATTGIVSFWQFLIDQRFHSKEASHTDWPLSKQIVFIWYFKVCWHSEKCGIKNNLEYLSRFIKPYQSSLLDVTSFEHLQHLHWSFTFCIFLVCTQKFPNNYISHPLIRMSIHRYVCISGDKK